mmetsp:Transcript_7105/g.15538  ORF Transcript_7105/g.15538 Transcript_7105/m.15538 type:complete len:221 (-) Transcript_7105:169-831(-)
MRSELPRQMTTSALSMCAWACLKICAGRVVSQSTAMSTSTPPQVEIRLLLEDAPLGASQVRPVGFSPMPPTSSSRMYSLPHSVQRSLKMFPCSSLSWASLTPLRRCSPSTFWLTRCVKMPACSRQAMALCAKDGMAWLKALCGSTATSPFCSRVHTPSGPRKSDIPQLVEIPAPVKITVCLDSSTMAASASTLLSRSSADSTVSGSPQRPFQRMGLRRLL